MKSELRFRFGLALTVLAEMTLLTLSATAQAPVNTESGTLVGTRNGNVRVFLGVPFAAPPVGPLRWRAPQPVVRSVAPLPADHYGASCMQKLSHSHLPWTEAFMVQNEVSEDCLYVNIWAPEKAKGAPVLVYLHGGGWVEGSGSIASYDGTALARRGLVVVDVNYRMGVFGFFQSAELVHESPHGSAGNYGLLDQLAALKWVQRNIAALGGDPKRVTVAGQSVGSMSVELLMASPAAKGLFTGAVMDSGLIFGPATALPTLQDAATLGDAFTAKHGGTLAALRALPADALLNATDVPARKPVVDGWLLPQQPDAELAHPLGSDMPVIQGWNADEGANATYGKLPAAKFREDVQTKYGAAAERFLQLYPAGTDAEASTSQVQAARDRNFAISELWALARSAGGRRQPVSFYYFARVPPWKAHPEFRTHHTAEVPYFFGTLDKVTDRDYTADDHAVSDHAAAAWVRFAGSRATWSCSEKSAGCWWIIDHDGATNGQMLSADKLEFWRGVLLAKP